MQMVALVAGLLMANKLPALPKHLPVRPETLPACLPGALMFVSAATMAVMAHVGAAPQLSVTPAVLIDTCA